MKNSKRTISLILILILLQSNFLFSYELNNTDNLIISAINTKINQVVSEKGEGFKETLITFLARLSKTTKSDRNKAIFTQLLYNLGVIIIDNPIELIPEPIIPADNASESITPSTDELSFVSKILNLVNIEREKKGLATLTLNSKLNQAAQDFAQYMNDSGDFAHTTKNGQTPVDRINAVGYIRQSMAENIARGQRDEIEVIASWMNSPGHKANILSEGNTELGVGHVGDYWVQVFGKQQ